LKKTIDDLYKLSPGVASLAVVPVGLTKYREGLPKLRNYDKDEARSIVNYVHSRQREFLKKIGSRFVWPADEFYIIGGLPFPRYHEYEEMPQFENGVGMVREFITMFRRRRRYLKNVKSGRRILFLTGYSAFQIIQDEIVPFMKDNVKLTVHPVINRFWGDTVTVTGLLTGQDLLREAKNKTTEFDALVIPPNCLNSDNLFLDNMSLTHFIKSLGKPVYVGRYNLVDTIKEVFI